MSEIHTEVVFGAQVKITVPMRPSKAAIQGILDSSRERINRLLSSAIGTALRTALPGFSVELTDVKSNITLTKVDE